MKKMTLQEALDDISKAISEAKNVDIESLIVEANSYKGFNYSYLLIYPQSNMKNTLVMDCLNDYEEPMSAGTIENQVALDEVFSLFGTGRVRPLVPNITNGQVQENYTVSKQRIAERAARGANHIGMLLTKGGLMQARMPIIMPLIPGYNDDTLQHTASEISKDFAGDIDIQVMRMIEDARQIIMDRANASLDNQIISYGHSKSATFAKNFATLHPEMVKGLVVGGGEDTPLPIEEIRLRVKSEVRENEKFEIIDGKAYKNITKDELEKIIDEYNNSKENYQRDIVQNQDGSYSLPINYPLGVADIEKYINISIFQGGKEEYKRTLAEIPRMLFVGEREEEKEGIFSYRSGVTVDGETYNYAEALNSLKTKKRPDELYEVEKASMHNRVLEYKQASLTLFGRGANERLKNYMDLATKLGLDVQAKIYENVGHGGIYGSRNLAEDTTDSLISISEGNGISKLNDNGGVQRITPIFQLLRRAKVCTTGDKTDYEAICSKLPSLAEEPDRANYQTDADFRSRRTTI
ncbi:MAG: hypothetical protein IKD74_04395 [Clostridia bacterium]|nr:hypothetical protein [Clostridia bacterium]